MNKPTGNERVFQETGVPTVHSNFGRWHMILENTFDLFQVRVQILSSRRWQKWHYVH